MGFQLRNEVLSARVLRNVRSRNDGEKRRGDLTVGGFGGVWRRSGDPRRTASPLHSCRFVRFVVALFAARMNASKFHTMRPDSWVFRLETRLCQRAFCGMRAERTLEMEAAAMSLTAYAKSGLRAKTLVSADSEPVAQQPGRRSRAVVSAQLGSNAARSAWGRAMTSARISLPPRRSTV